nr:CPCC family cysteine-rich protein [Nocardioides lijunqiniae]
MSDIAPRNPRTNASIALEAIERWPDDPARFAVELVLVSTAHPCACCGHVVFNEPPGSYEICPVCFWEDDAVQLRWPTYEGGANGPSLIDSQRAYATDGAMECRFTDIVRPPTEGEPLDPNWRPIDPESDSFEGSDERQADWPADLTTLYWWRATFWRSDEQQA